jgi:site-specific recombinase XerD
MTTGTELEIIPPQRTEIAGSDAERLPTLHTTAKTDDDLIVVWLKSHADGSPHTLRAYERIGRRFVAALAAARTNLRHATVDHVQIALEAMRTKADGSPASAATINTQVAAVKALLGFAHKVGFTRFNAAPLIKLRKAPRQLAQRILSEVDVQLLIREARLGRNRVMFEVAYYGGLRVSEIASLTWAQVIPRETGEVQLALVGKGDKERHVLIPTDIAKGLLALRGNAPSSDRVRVFQISERRINQLIKAAAKRAKVNPDASPHWLRHAHASHAIDNGAPITLVSQTLGHADLKTTSVYAHARPNESSSRYLKSR